GDGHDVAERVGEADDPLPGGGGAAGLEGVAEHGGPAEEQQGGGDQQAVQQGPQSGRGPHGGGRERPHPGEQQRHGGQEAGVGQGRHPRLAAAQLGDGPDDPAQAPEQGGRAEQAPGPVQGGGPGAAEAGGVAVGGVEAGGGGARARGRLDDVAGQLGDPGPADPEHDPDKEQDRQRRRGDDDQAEVPQLSPLLGLDRHGFITVAPRERELGSCCTAPNWCKASPNDTRAEGDVPATWSRGTKQSARWSHISIAYPPPLALLPNPTTSRQGRPRRTCLAGTELSVPSRGRILGPGVPTWKTAHAPGAALCTDRHRRPRPWSAVCGSGASAWWPC